MDWSDISVIFKEKTLLELHVLYVLLIQYSKQNYTVFYLNNSMRNHLSPVPMLRIFSKLFSEVKYIKLWNWTTTKTFTEQDIRELYQKTSLVLGKEKTLQMHITSLINIYGCYKFKQKVLSIIYWSCLSNCLNWQILCLFFYPDVLVYWIM